MEGEPYQSPIGSMRYHNLDVWIESSPAGGYLLHARCSDHGETEAASLPDSSKLRDNLELLASGEADRDFIVRFGSLLYEYVFAAENGRIGLHFGRCSELARVTSAEGVRLRLRIEDPDVATVPWEYLYSPIQEDFLSVSIATPVVRYLELPEPPRPLTAGLPLHMLVVIPERSGLDTGTERAYLMEALDDLRSQGLICLHVLDGSVTRARLTDVMLEQRYDIFHFIGHGDFHDDEAFLVLNGDGDADDFVDHEWMARLFANHPSMKLVVLNSCKGAQVSATKPLVGIAPQLVRKDIPAVVAMQYEIADEEALCFARAFYRSLFLGFDRGRVEVAVSHARNELLKKFPDMGALGAPVLFMRGSEGVVFDIESRKRLRDVPFDPRALDRTNAVIRAHEQRIQSGLEEHDETFVATERRELARVKQQLRFRNASLVSAAGIALVVFFGFWMYAFDWLPQQLKPETYTVALGDLFTDSPLHDAVALVSIDQQTVEAVGKPFDLSWRAEHALLVDRLARAGARVVAFDLYFLQPTSHDADFARAIRNAARSGTHVILGANRWTADDRPAMVEELREASGTWASLCMALSWHGPNVAPLMSVTSDGRRVPSLALGAVAAYDGAARFDLDVENRQVNIFNEANTATRRIRLADVNLHGERPGDCTVIRRNDPYGELIIDYTPLETLRERRLSYERVLQADLDALRPLVEGKIVLVGLELGRDDRRSIWRGFNLESRYGLMLHADAVNTLLQDVSIRWLGGWAQFFIIICMAIVGAALGYRAPQGSRFLRAATLAAVPAAYVVGSVYLYLAHHLLLNGVYHILAFFVSYWTVKKLKPRFFP